MSTAVALMLTLAGAAATEPPPVPSGMDLLYSDRVSFRPSGEPLIAIGLMSGQPRVLVRSATTIRADYYDAGVLKTTTVRPGDPVEITVKRAQPAKRRIYVDLEGIGWGKTDMLDWALAGWRARGYPEVKAIEQGTVLGIGGRVLDNREYRVVLPVSGSREASTKVAEVYERFGTRALVNARLAERPWAELTLRVAGAPVGLATSFVRFVTPEGTIGVDKVEIGKGYSWHGFRDRQYHGELYLVVDPDGRLAAVNVLGAETVLKSTVPSEMFATSPAEALKAQAVAARNQLYAKLGKRHHDDPFHLCSHQHCQVYSGVSKEHQAATAAVETTSGEVLFFNERLVDTVYSSTCGGHTEDNDAVWGNTADPALRGRPDFIAKDGQIAFTDGIPPTALRGWLESLPATFCSKSTKTRAEKFRWQKTLTAADLRGRLGSRYAWIGVLERIEVEERGRGGRVISLALIGNAASATVIHELPIRRLFGNLNSGAFVLDHERTRDGKLVSVTFTGGGWGHGVGMCQLGAIGRAEAGHSYTDILKHYYNGAAPARLYGE